MRRTLRCKIAIPDDCRQLVLDTITRYSSVCNELINFATKNKLYSRYKLQHAAYHSIRKMYNLPSQLTITAIWKVVETLRASRKRRKCTPSFSKYASIRLNYPRNFSFKYPHISFTTLEGRVTATIIGAESKLLTEIRNNQWEITESHLCYDKARDTFYFNLSLQKESPQTQEGINPIGVDLGIRRIAVTSLGQFFSNKHILHTKHRYDLLKSKLQSVGTKSAKRHLKKLKGKIRKFQRDVNHVISKKLVNTAQAIANSAIVFEDLTYIRQTTKQRKDQRRDHHRWAFRELQTFTSYKAEGIGIPVVLVDPRGTSHICSGCGSIDVSRKGLKFLCHNCNLLLDADLNASRNIASRYILEAKVVCQPANRSTRYNGQSSGLP